MRGGFEKSTLIFVVKRVHMKRTRGQIKCVCAYEKDGGGGGGDICLGCKECEKDEWGESA